MLINFLYITKILSNIDDHYYDNELKYRLEEEIQ